MKCLIRILLLACVATRVFSAEPPPEYAGHKWVSLFDGKSLDGWTVTPFGGAGQVEVRDGRLVIELGAAISGAHRTNAMPTSNYEISIRLMKVDGNDFFCGVTFPVKDSHATFIAGGWGGSLVGVSSLDGMDASENEATTYMRFEKNKDYQVLIRVTDDKIQAWIDGAKLVDANIKGRRVSLRPGEIEESKPFGIATYQTTASVAEVKARTIPTPVKKIALLAGKKSHGPGEHEYEKSLKLLRGLLQTSPGIAAIDVDVHTAGWPVHDEDLDDVDTIVLFSDGADHGESHHPILKPERLIELKRQMDRGCGLVVLHYSVFVPIEKAGNDFLQWSGGHFDYETGPGANKWFSKIETREFEVFPVAGHPVANGLGTFKIREEFYFNMRFPKEKAGWAPILSLDAGKSDASKVVAWAISRPGGGRGAGFTGGHFYANWEAEAYRKLLLNMVMWTAGAEVPPGGFESAAPAEPKP